MLPAPLRALRPHQWIKNVFVLAALVFALGEDQAATGEVATDAFERVLRVAYAVGAFCLAASSVYVLNDILDVESDRNHPGKRHRAIASGALKIPHAMALGVACLALAIVLSVLATPAGGDSVTLILALYLASNVLYSFKLKQVAILDAFLIALGFMLRVVAGAYAAAAPISNWLLLSTLFLALFLAFCKRRAELDLLGDEAASHRRNLGVYTPAFLEQTTSVLAGCATMTYALYAVDQSTIAKFKTDQYGLVWTVPFVVFGLFRYLLIVQRQEGGGNPSRVLLGGDTVFVLNALAWAGTIAGFLYFR